MKSDNSDHKKKSAIKKTITNWNRYALVGYRQECSNSKENQLVSISNEYIWKYLFTSLFLKDLNWKQFVLLEKPIVDMLAIAVKHSVNNITALEPKSVPFHNAVKKMHVSFYLEWVLSESYDKHAHWQRVKHSIIFEAKNVSPLYYYIWSKNADLLQF